MKCAAKLQKDTWLDVNSYQLRAQPNSSTEDAAPVGLSIAEYLDCILLYSHEPPSENSVSFCMFYTAHAEDLMAL